MTTERDSEQILAAWLDEGPTDLPSATRRAILTALPTTPQARRGPLAPWRLFEMHPLARGSIAALVAVLVLGSVILVLGGRGPTFGNVSSPSPVASSTATASGPPPLGARLGTLDATFLSPWYGYTVEYPSGWTVTAGAGPWPPRLNLLHGDPHLDQIVSPSGPGRMRIVGASIALPSGTTMDGFRAFASPPGPACVEKAPLPAGLMIDGVAALVDLNGCASLSELGGNIYDVLVIEGGRGYDFTLDGDLTVDEATRWLASIKLQPAAAPAETSSWTTHASARNGVSFGVPPRWAVVDATRPWAMSGSSPVSPSPWAFDQVIAPDGGGLVVASQKVGGGVSAAAWPAFVAGVCHPVPPNVVPTTIVDSQLGSILISRCAAAAVIAQGRVYVMNDWALLEKPSVGAVDPALFMAWLTTVRFDAASAVDTPASPAASS